VCLIAFSLPTASTAWSLVIAANRDEAYARPTKPAHWRKHKGRWIFAGQDLAAGGTWMGFREDGHWAALTNVREPLEQRAQASGRSRGHLVLDALTDPQAWSDDLLANRFEDLRPMAGFNLLVGSERGVRIHSNRSASSVWLDAHTGTHAISNGVLLQDWPKTQRLRRAVDRALASFDAQAQSLRAALFEALGNSEPAQDHELPDTGVGLAMERMLSPAFIQSEHYGTRVSTVALFGPGGQVAIEERSRYGPQTHSATQFIAKR
jgi:uncharacterized protein with NRDE domain